MTTTENQADSPSRRGAIEKTSDLFRGGVEYIPSEIMRIDDLDPTGREHTHPTPLDPESMWMLRDGRNDYFGNSMRRLVHRVEVVAKRVGLPEDELERVMTEIGTQANWRCARNQESYERLMNAVDAGKPLLDDEMKRIIRLARTGDADLPQLVRLIKEYPQMISAEVFKFTKPFDSEAMELAMQNLKDQVADLTRNFRDAEVTLHFDDNHMTRLKDPYIDDTGVCVEKYLLADIKSRDSHSQIIAKTTELIVSPGLKLKQPLPEPQEIVFDGRRYDACLLPLSLTAYLRTFDYEKREGYIHPNIGARAVKAAEILAALQKDVPDVFVPPGLPEDMLEVYAEAVRTAAMRKEDVVETVEG